MGTYITTQKPDATNAADQKAPPGIKYLDMQAYVGITKHTGGREATDELLSLCHIQDAREVLNVGCGIGVSSAYIVKAYGCRVVGVDLSEKMIEWSRLRTREERIEDKVDFRVADGRFDAVIAESVIAFVADKARAIRECIRVAKPGGYVGFNESYTNRTPTPEIAGMIRREFGVDLPLLAEWQSLWDASGLNDRTFNTHAIDARREVQGRMQWIGAGWVIRAFGRLFRLYLTRPEARQSLKAQFGSVSVSLADMGYAVFAGRKEPS